MRHRSADSTKPQSLARRFLAAAMVVLGASLAAEGCLNNQECARNSDCTPGRFCSDDNFCDFQCRNDRDCGDTCGCDLRFGLCVAGKMPALATESGRARCCTTEDKLLMSVAKPADPGGVCILTEAANGGASGTAGTGGPAGAGGAGGLGGAGGVPGPSEEGQGGAGGGGGGQT